MPGAEVIAGECREFIAPEVPQTAPALSAVASDDGIVQLSWERSAATIGLESEIYRSDGAGFVRSQSKPVLLTRTMLFTYVDSAAPVSEVSYALVLTNGSTKSKAAYATVTVKPAPRRLRRAA